MKTDSKVPFSWFPGHMLKAEREIKKRLALIDLTLEIVDARAPLSTRNFRLGALLEGKPRVIVLNKTDLSDPKTTKEWCRSFDAEGIPAVAITKDSKDLNEVLIDVLSRTITDHDHSLSSKYRRFHSIRAMVVGVPNVGKSTIINSLVGQKKAHTGAMPGLTRQQQWVKLNDEIELMDNPGIMIPRIPDEETGLKLGLLAVVTDKVVDLQCLAEYLFSQFRDQLGDKIKNRYELDMTPESIAELLEQIGRRHGILGRGGGVDIEKSAIRLVDDFRQSRLGRISLEVPTGL